MKYYIYLTPREGSPQHQQFNSFWNYQSNLHGIVNDAIKYPAHATLYHGTQYDEMMLKFNKLKCAFPSHLKCDVITELKFFSNNRITSFNFTSLISYRFPDITNLHITLLHNCNQRNKLETKISTTFNPNEWTNEWDITMWSHNKLEWTKLTTLML